MGNDFDRTIVDQTAHRPWPMPAAPWLMTQTWNDLLFAHWPTDVERLRAMIPAQFELDTYNGEAWIGVVPFYMTNVSPRGVPSLPWISEFPELNVRTYVTVGGRPGVYFFSLDAGSALAVKAAHLLLNLPYFTAEMSIERDHRRVSYHSRRTDSPPTARFRATYTPTGSMFTAEARSLDYFLTERYCLYNLDHHGRPYRLEIHHPPWPLHPADADVFENTMTMAAGVTVAERPPVLHFAKRQDMVAWAPTALA